MFLVRAWVYGSPGQPPCALHLRRWLADGNRCCAGKGAAVSCHSTGLPSPLSSVGSDAWSRIAPLLAARLFSSFSNKELSLQPSQQSNLQTGHFEKVSYYWWYTIPPALATTTLSARVQSRIKKLRFILRDAAAAQLMSRSLELPENYLLRFPYLLQIDLVQRL